MITNDNSGKSSEKIVLQKSFDEFWAAYPKRRGDRKRAQKLFEALSDADKFNAIQRAAYQMEHDPQWKDPTYIPLPTTYLHQRRWEDEIVQGKDAKARVVERQDSSAAHTVWSAMTQMYGDAWIKRHGEEPNEVWRKMLSIMTEAQVKRGLRTTFDSGGDFPPSLPKFAEYCKGQQRLPEFKSLPRPPSDPEKAAAAFKQMKDILGIK